jgi:hypothetical protein
VLFPRTFYRRTGREVLPELQEGCLGYALGEQFAIDQSFEPMVADERCKARLPS